MTAVPPRQNEDFYSTLPSLALFQVTSWRIKDSNEVFFENEQLCFFDALESQKVVLKTPLGEMKDVIMEEQLQTSAEKKKIIALQDVAGKWIPKFEAAEPAITHTAPYSAALGLALSTSSSRDADDNSENS
jgi:hypothetical protein